MTLGGVIHRFLMAGGASLLLGALPAAAQEARAAGAPGPRFFAPGARLSDPLPTFRDPLPGSRDGEAVFHPLPHLPALGPRAGEGLPFSTRRSDGASRYGVLAGSALLSALDAGDVLPEATRPWFDGDADRMVAGFEFSF